MFIFAFTFLRQGCTYYRAGAWEHPIADKPLMLTVPTHPAFLLAFRCPNTFSGSVRGERLILLHRTYLNPVTLQLQYCMAHGFSYIWPSAVDCKLCQSAIPLYKLLTCSPCNEAWLLSNTWAAQAELRTYTTPILWPERCKKKVLGALLRESNIYLTFSCFSLVMKILEKTPSNTVMPHAFHTGNL